MSALAAFRQFFESQGIRTVLEPEALEVPGVVLRLSPRRLEEQGEDRRALTLRAVLTGSGQGEVLWQSLLSALEILSSLSGRTHALPGVPATCTIALQGEGGFQEPDEGSFPLFVSEYEITLSWRTT